MNKYNYSEHFKRYHSDTEIDSQPRTQWLATLLAPLLPPSKHARVLDIGCGFGFALSALKKLGYDNVMGLELSPDQAAVARGAGHDVVVTEDSVAWMKASPDSFDFIILLDVLEHIPVGSQIEFCAVVKNALRLGGKVLIEVPNANSILAARWRYIDYTHCCSFTEDSLIFVLRSSGFEDIQFHVEKGLGRFPRRIWRRSNWPAIRKWIVRWCWLQVFKAEVPFQNIEEISFELNLRAMAGKNA